MINSRQKKDLVISILAYLTAIILCVLILICVMELWRADLKIPFRYSGDALWSCISIKGVIDNGWYLHNNYLGMPQGLDAYDFPSTESFHFLLIKFISFFNSDYAYVMNLYFLLTFPLTTMTSLYVFRQFNIPYIPSIITSLLYTFLPYHFMRGETHLFLAAYYTIPLIVMVVLWLTTENNFLFKYDENSGKQKFEFNFQSISSIFICLLISSTGLYYAFFACFFILIGGIYLLITERKKYKLLAVETLIILIVAGTIINIIPNMIYISKNGINSEAVQRHPVETEFYGMKIDQLLMPVDGHRLPAASGMKDRYNKIAPIVNENSTSTLGLIGSIGFLVLISRILFNRTKESNINVESSIGLLNISAVLLATVGGFSYFAALIIPGIRSYNRISVYIAFFSFFAFNLLLVRLYQKYISTKAAHYLYCGLLGLILIIGILDQTNRLFIPPYDLTKAEYESDENFIKNIEESLPSNAMVFQLPYIVFPENLTETRIVCYDLFKGYLHSDSLRWSYGAMKGREGDLWQNRVVKKPLNEFLETISLVGFSGIYIDRNAYEDKGAEIEAGLKSILTNDPIVSTDRRLVFYNIEDYSKRLKSMYTFTEWEIMREKAMVIK
jgi:phosphoglycerol transferase